MVIEILTLHFGRAGTLQNMLIFLPDYHLNALGE